MISTGFVPPRARRGNRARSAALLLAIAQFGFAPAVHAQDARFVLPFAELERRLIHEEFTIQSAVISRPKVATDITLKSEVTFTDGVPMRIKIRRAQAGGGEFNNEPRYELAAYLFQKTFLAPDEYVVPPTALRFFPVDTLRKFAPAAKPTFYGTRHTLCVLQYWLKNVSAPDDAYDHDRFNRDPEFALHLANLNVLTYLIDHKDSNSGNVLMAVIPDSGGQPDEADPRVFMVDNGVAFDSEPSDKGSLWQVLRVPRIPKATVERLSRIRQEDLTALLGTIAQWEVRDGVPVEVPLEKPSNAADGVRSFGKRIQLGLTKHEIGGIYRRMVALRNRVASGDVETF